MSFALLRPSKKMRSIPLHSAKKILPCYEAFDRRKDGYRPLGSSVAELRENAHVARRIRAVINKRPYEVSKGTKML